MPLGSIPSTAKKEKKREREREREVEKLGKEAEHGGARL